MRLWLTLCLFGCALLTASSARADGLESVSAIHAELNASYRPGEAGEVAISFAFAAPELERGVLFLNVVERDAARTYPQAAHLIFASASETPGIFRRVYSAEQLAAGLATTLSFRLRDNAKPGDYALVLQLYQGSVSHPNRVRPEDRLVLKSFNFSIEPR